MTTISLKDFYPWYKHDELVEVSDEIVEAIAEAERLERNAVRRQFYNRAYFSLDADDGIEASAIVHECTSPCAILEMAETH